MGTLFRLALLLVACCSVATDATATSYVKRPHQDPTLLSNGERLIAQESWDSLGLYRTADGTLTRRFVATAGIARYALSPDEAYLLVGCVTGEFTLWRLEAAEPVWQTHRPMPGIPDAWDVSFSGDGNRFAVCSQGEEAVVFDARNGKVVGTIGPSRTLARVQSVALARDGTHGHLIDRWRLYRFDVATGRAVDAELRAGRPVRYCTDGKFVTFPCSCEGDVEQVSFISADGPPAPRPLGKFGFVGRVRPMPDGSFLVTAEVGRQADQTYAGSLVWPDGRVAEVWALGHRSRVNERTDFLPGPMIGASTNWELITTVTDLRTGQVTLTIDNSENYWSAQPDRRRPLLWGGAAAVGMGVGWFIWRRRRSRPRPTPPAA